MNNMIKTIDFGYLPIRKTHTYGELLETIELVDGMWCEVIRDITTNQLFIKILN